MPSTFSVIKIAAYIFALFVAVLYFYSAWQIHSSNPVGFYLLLLLGLGGGIVAFHYFTGKSRRRQRVLRRPFPKVWRRILIANVEFYRKLDPDERKRFEQEVQIFLDEKRLSGINTEINDRIRVLVAASAVIPIFGFPGWEYPNLEEVLIYPGSFDDDFRQSGRGRDILGMVGEGEMNRMMILSKPAILEGFHYRRDGIHTALHEFVHLFDAADGAYDGVPPTIDQRDIEPWRELMHREMERIREGRSALDPYAATGEEEFFAVAGEYFFENPEFLHREHAELYQMLVRIFRQDTLQLFFRKQ